MGMFDYLHCDLPLPVGQDWLYQTKDTGDQWLKNHTITKAGRLVLHNYDTEATPEDELPYKNAPKDSFLRVIGCIRRVQGSERDEDQNFDGDIVFYPDCMVHHPEADDLEYRATFRGGNCTEICQQVGAEWKRVWPADPEVG
jgi:hypothetical protein